MAPPEMRETTNRPLLDSSTAQGPFVQPGAGQVEEVTERTALLTRKAELIGQPESEPVRKEEHFRNIDKRTFWILFATIIFGNIVAFFDSTLMYVFEHRGFRSEAELGSTLRSSTVSEC